MDFKAVLLRLPGASAIVLTHRLAAAAWFLGGLVLVLGAAVSAGWFRAFDLAVSHALNLQRGISPDWLIALMQAISWIGGGAQRYIIAAILALALWRWRGWRAGLAMAVTTLLSALMTDFLKFCYARLRPDLVPHLDFVDSAAFPSGHATNAALIYILLILLVPQARRSFWQWAAAAMIFLTGLSRIMLGMHWPTDVIGGWMLGTAFALMAAAVSGWRRPQRHDQSSLVAEP